MCKEEECGEEEDIHCKLDIPLEYRGIEQYCATLGHKCNHSFSPNCYFSQVKQGLFLTRFRLIL